MLSTYCRYIYIPSLICFCFCFFLAMLLASVPFNLWCTVPAWDKSNHNLNGTDIYACAYGTYSAATETLLSACIYAGYHALSSGFREPQHYTCMKLQLSWSSPADEAKVRGRHSVEGQLAVGRPEVHKISIGLRRIDRSSHRLVRRSNAELWWSCGSESDALALACMCRRTLSLSAWTSPVRSSCAIIFQ